MQDSKIVPLFQGITKFELEPIQSDFKTEITERHPGKHIEFVFEWLGRNTYYMCGNVSEPHVTAPLREVTRALALVRQIRSERRNQIARWGHESLPFLSKDLVDSRDEMLKESRSNYEFFEKHGQVTWYDVIDEELWELYCARSYEEFRDEAVQLLAVIHAMIGDVSMKQKFQNRESWLDNDGMVGN